MNNRYMLTTDGDSHWFVIPAEKQEEWGAFCEAAEKYWGEDIFASIIPADYEAPVQPEWAVALGGGPSCVTFSDYEIGKRGHA